MVYYLNGINAIVFEWLKNGCDKSVKEISEIITICVYGLKRTDIQIRTECSHNCEHSVCYFSGSVDL